MAKRRQFTPEFKVNVVLEILSGVKTTAEICREHKLQPQMVNRWRSTFVEQAATIFENASGQTEEQQRVAELERLAGRLALELEVAKKASSILQRTRNGNER